LIETLLVQDGHFSHLSYHQKRFDETRKSLFGASPLALEEYLNPPLSGQFRCRIVYNESIQDITYTPYEKKELSALVLTQSALSYHYKYLDRPFPPLQDNGSDILYYNNDLVTDTTICNVAFLDQDRWITPLSPLLKGTTRERLIDEGFLLPRDIYTKEIPLFQKVAVMNALRGFDILGTPKEVILSLFCYNTKS
jgi:4-amino-4-deoxychorismate lyase